MHPSKPGEWAFVYLAVWEYQCCGEPVALGQTYDWWVVPCNSASEWDAALGATVSLMASHHAMEPGTRQVRVRVHNLWTAGARYAHTASGVTMVPGTAQIAGIDMMDPWAEGVPVDDGVVHVAGWIAEVQIMQELPAYQPEDLRRRGGRN